jgi:hypothetical protein
MTDILIERLTCRRATLIREEAIDDIRKLQAFFNECKSNNSRFYYKFQLNKNNVVKNVFWSHASKQGKYKGNKKNSVLCTIKMTDYYIDEKYLTIK